jgi:archaemetzincin
MDARIISIVPLGDVPPFILKNIAQSIINTFKNIETRILQLSELTTQFPEPLYGGKYNSTQVLSLLSQVIPDDTFRLLAVTELDLYSPIFSCIFGEAQFKGSCALVSLSRLRQEYYNLKPDQDLFKSRYEKEVIHEISHTMGLLHCENKHCIMYYSSNIIDTDVKSSTFCPECQVMLKITTPIV